MPRFRAKIIIDEGKLAKLLKTTLTLSPRQRGSVGRCRAAYSFWERHKLDRFDKNALSKEICFCRGGAWTGGPGCVICFPINAPGMSRFQLLNLGGFGLWVRVNVLGSDCNNRFPNTNHNLNHNSNDNLTLNPKSNHVLTLTLTVY